jgi:hypothetical protein
MATGGQFYWPSSANFVAAYGQFFMAANKTHRPAVSACPGWVKTSGNGSSIWN